MFLHGSGQGVLDHFRGYVGRGVIGSGRHPIRSGIAVFGDSDEVFEQAADYFRVNGLVAAAGSMFGCGPVVFAEDGEQSRRFGFRSEICGVVQLQQAVVLVSGEQGAVQETRFLKRLLYSWGGVGPPVCGRLVQPFVEQEGQDAVVIAAVGFVSG